MASSSIGPHTSLPGMNTSGVKINPVLKKFMFIHQVENI